MSRTISAKVMWWIRRYLPCEIVGTITALLGAGLTYHTTDSLLLAAISGTIWENVGYYGTASAREMWFYYQKHRQHPRLKRLFLTVGHSLRGMLTEFGPAELIDSFAVRPALLYLTPLLVSNIWIAWLAGKLLADIVFYVFAALGVIMRQKIFQDAAASAPFERSSE